MRQLLVATLSVAFVLFAPGESSAQAEPQPGETSAQTKFHYGLKGGIDFSTLRGDFSSPLLSGESFGYYRSFAAGAFFTFHLNDIVALQPEFLWVRKASIAEIELPQFPGSQTLGPLLDYIEVPLLVRFSPRTEGSIDPIFYVGPNFGFNVKATLRTVVDDQLDTDNIENQIKGYDLGIVVGGGIVIGESQLRGFGQRTVRYTVEGRFTAGLTDILIDEEAGPSAGDFKNSTFALMVGIIY